MTTRELEWDCRWMRVAETYASFSKDPSTRVGAVAVVDKRVVSAGWNGFPRGILDDERLSDRPTKYKLVVHAEMNCVFNACHVGSSLAGSTVYVSGLLVCSDCAKGLIQAGVRRVVMKVDREPDVKWKEEFEWTVRMFGEAGIAWELWDANRGF